MEVRATVLTHDILCDFCIGSFDIYRVLEPFFIIPHKLSAPSFHLPWKWLFNPLPGITVRFQCIVNGKRSITLGIFFHQLLALPGTVLIKCKSFLAAGMSIKIEKNIINGKTDLINTVQKFFSGCTGISIHHLCMPLLPQNGLHN